MVEAKASHSKRDYIKYFEIALKSANETKYWLAIIKSMKYQENRNIDSILKENIEIANVLAASILTLKNKR